MDSVPSKLSESKVQPDVDSSLVSFKIENVVSIGIFQNSGYGVEMYECPSKGNMDTRGILRRKLKKMKKNWKKKKKKIGILEG